MADIQITCINKQNRQSSHEGITHVGGTGWRKTRQEVIVLIDNKTNSYFTKVNGKRADVGVVQSNGTKYLRTYADGQWNDNLLALPECS